MKNKPTTARSLVATLLFASLAGGVDAKDEFSESGFAPTVERVSGSQTLNQGDWLVGFSGSYNYVESEGDSVNLFFAEIDFSYFLTPNITVGASSFGLLIPSGGVVEETGYALGIEPHLRYYWHNSSNFTPYFGIHGGVAYGEVDSEGDALYTYGADLGVLVPLTENAYFDARLKWSEYELPSDFDVDLTSIQVLVGFKIKF